ncbi:peptidoglycan DD-metalloendopeptidase family protein [Alloalcanivorax balearicus]|nr:peptidoglycan DD-metalloendopeptidase family protein [Alloalcanivorax balearicus]
MTESTATTRTSRSPLLRAMVPALAAAIALASWWWAPSGDAALMTDRALLGLIEDSDLYAVDVDPAPTVWEHYTIAQGDSLANLWTNQWQLPEAALYTLLNDPRSADILRQVSPGQHLEWRADGEGSLLALRLWTDPSKGWEWNLRSGQLHRTALTYERNLHQVAVRGEIRTSLSAALAEMPSLGGRAQAIAAEMGELLPLASKARKGDRFSLLVDLEYIDDAEGAYAARLAGFDYEGEQISVRAARFDDDRFYTPEGKSLLPGFRRTPFNSEYRISSPFNLHRHHPITGRVTPHLGTDFAMPVGTRVLAPAKGVVRTVSYHPLAGRFVVIDHGQGYQTRYLHLQKAQVRPGQEVKPGDVIALSGNTGRSTGSHLHYELRLNGRPLNPMTASLPSRERLQPDELRRFQNQYAAYFDLHEQESATAVAGNGNRRDNAG